MRQLVQKAREEQLSERRAQSWRSFLVVCLVVNLTGVAPSGVLLLSCFSNSRPCTLLTGLVELPV